MSTSGSASRPRQSKGVEIASGGRIWRMAPASLTAAIVPGQKPPLEVEELPLGTWPATLTSPPISVSLYVVAGEASRSSRSTYRRLALGSPVGGGA